MWSYSWPSVASCDCVRIRLLHRNAVLIDKFLWLSYSNGIFFNYVIEKYSNHKKDSLINYAYWLQENKTISFVIEKWTSTNVELFFWVFSEGLRTENHVRANFPPGQECLNTSTSSRIETQRQYNNVQGNGGCYKIAVHIVETETECVSRKTRCGSLSITSFTRTWAAAPVARLQRHLCQESD